MQKYKIKLPGRMMLQIDLLLEFFYIMWKQIFFVQFDFSLEVLRIISRKWLH